MSRTKHQWNQSRKRLLIVWDFLLYNQKTNSWCIFFPVKAQMLAALQIRAVLIINPTAFAQNGRARLSIPALNPGAHFPSVLINVNNPWRCSFQEIVCCLLVSGSCLSCYLDIFKPNFVLKLSNRPLLALNSPALDPSPFFCSKLSYNDFTFLKSSQKSIDMSFLEQSCTRIKTAFLI